MRKLTSLPLVLVLSLGTVAACGSSDDDDDAKKKDDATCKTVDSGDSSDAVEVTGTFGETGPKTTFAKPLAVDADDLQRTVLDEGNGDTTADGDQVEAVITIFNGRTGKQALSEKATLVTGDENTFAAFRAGIECVPAGSRVVTTVAAKDVYGDQGYADLDIKPADSLVIVTDVVGVREEVKAKPWTEDVPEVSLKGKKPKVTLPKTDPPKDVLVKVLEEGDGDTIEAGDSPTVHYQGRTWESGGKVFQQSFGEGEPVPMPLDSVVQGFKAGLVDQKVGSTVMITMPPEYGFGEAESEEDELAGKTVLFVVEIVSND